MRFLRPRILAGCIAALVFCATGLARCEAPRSTNYYPLEVGNRWTCEVTTNGKKQKVITRVTAIDTSSGEKVARLEAVKYGNIVGVEYLSQNEQGVFRHWVLGKKASPPLQILRYPVVDGDHWDSETIVDGRIMRSTTSVKVEEMTVPEGSFKIAVADTTVKSSAISIWSRTWYVPDAGIAKQMMTVGPIRVELQLEKFEPAKQ